MQTLQGEKYFWHLPATDQKLVLDIASAYNISFPIAQTLITRGLTTKQELDAYLFSELERDVASASLMKDARKSVDRIIHAINHKEKILICGDYDVDGVTSSALMLFCLLPLGADVNYFLPHRVKDGYGLSTKTVRKAAESGYKLMITVDNGITALEPAAVAKELEVDLIITDHHRPHDHVPDAFAIVNPQQRDCPYPFKMLAGVGVSFKVLSLLYEVLGKPMPAKAYELLLLGTIADVVPLQGENRFWVRHGLNHVNQTESFALKVLKANGNLAKPRISSTDIGFSIAPQINALGRLEDARAGVRFLIGADHAETERVGKILLELNQARKDIDRGIFAQIEAKIKSNVIDLTQENIIMASSDAWPPGVIGLVASKLVGTYGKPTLLFHVTKDGIAKGSCRSIEAFNMFNALQANQHLLLQFGGHAQAAGLSLKAENLPQLKANLEELLLQQITPADLVLKLKVDAQAQLGDLTKKFMHDLEHLEPFGHQNAQPIFYIPDVVQAQKPILMKDAHVKCHLFADGVIKPLVFFNRPELYEKLLSQESDPFSIAAQVTENYWNGRVNIEMMGVDVAGLK